MRVVLSLLVLVAGLAAEASAVTVAWSPVGNAGNAPDSTGYGAVAYNYNIGTYDVTNSQYAEFLNTKDPTGANTLGLWNGNMPDANFGGININPGNANGSKYVLTAGAQHHPVNYVTWYDAIRFANWLNNGQGNADTETGAYTLLGGTPTPSNAGSITRNAGATVFLPSENEWYKAAYYDPRTAAQGGPPFNNHYWEFGTSSNLTPIASVPTALANHANYDFAVGNLTDVGAYSGTRSPYGAFDMNGNVFQWDETSFTNFNGTNRGVLGGWFNGQSYLYSGEPPPDDAPTSELNIVGFRVAMIPEPSSIVLAAIGLVSLAAWGWRRRLSHG